MRKSPLGDNPLTAKEGRVESGDSELKSETKGSESKIPGLEKEIPTQGPKFRQMKPLEARLREDQVRFLDRFIKGIRDHRRGNCERVTKNTVLRALVDVLREMEIDDRDIFTEEDLRQRFQEVFLQKRSRRDVAEAVASVLPGTEGTQQP